MGKNERQNRRAGKKAKSVIPDEFCNVRLQPQICY